MAADARSARGPGGSAHGGETTALAGAKRPSRLASRRGERLKKRSVQAKARATPLRISDTLRLDAMAKRLEATVQAVKTVRPALQDFYASLNDEQKARFNTMNQQAQHQG